MKKLLKSEVCRSRKQCTDPLLCIVHHLFCWMNSAVIEKSKITAKKIKEEMHTQNTLLFSYPNHTRVCQRYFGEFDKVVGLMENNKKKSEKNDYLNKIYGKIDKLMWMFCKNGHVKKEKVSFFLQNRQKICID